MSLKKTKRNTEFTKIRELLKLKLSVDTIEYCKLYDLRYDVKIKEQLDESYGSTPYTAYSLTIFYISAMVDIAFVCCCCAKEL